MIAVVTLLARRSLRGTAGLFFLLLAAALPLLMRVGVRGPSLSEWAVVGSLGLALSLVGTVGSAISIVLAIDGEREGQRCRLLKVGGLDGLSATGAFVLFGVGSGTALIALAALSSLFAFGGSAEIGPRLPGLAGLALAGALGSVPASVSAGYLLPREPALVAAVVSALVFSGLLMPLQAPEVGLEVRAGIVLFVMGIVDVVLLSALPTVWRRLAPRLWS